MNELTADVVGRTTMYFAQRRPSELGSFTWTIDAKDPKKITTQEQWWKDTLGPLQESRSEAKPLSRVYDPRFDYSFFDKAYRFEKAKWYPHKPRRPMVGYDIGKILLDHVSFKDSRADILLQAIDILTSFLRRSFIGQVSDLATVRTLGRLQIHRQIKGHIQSMTIVGITPGKRTYPFVRMLEQMSLAGRSMLVPKPHKVARGSVARPSRSL